MKKAMLSQPMAGKTDEEIVATREKAIKILEEKGYEVVNFGTDTYEGLLASILMSCSETIFYTISVYLLATGNNKEKPLCHAAYFCKGWENARGCKIEHDAAVAYGLDIIYEE